MSQIPGLYILENDHGRGVYTAIDIPEGSLIEICPVIIISKVELPIIHKTTLHDYYFLWGPNLDQAAIALGYGSLYNHAVESNADFILDLEDKTISIVAIEDISAGTEIRINYHGEQGDARKLWF